MRHVLKMFALVGLMAASAAPAHAGFGATAYLTSASNLGGGIGAPMWAPSLDYRFKGLLFQLPALNLIGGFASQHLDVGLAFSGQLAKGEITGNADGIFMLGGDVRYYAPTGSAAKNSSGFELMLKGRLGAEMRKKMGFGIYVVPELGISNFVDGNPKTSARDLGIAWGGGLEVSAWFAGR